MPEAALPPVEIQKLMIIVEDLNQVMEEETTLLEKHQYKTHPDILRRKQELAFLYQNAMKVFSDSPDQAKALMAEQRLQLSIAGQKLAATTQRNAKALQLAQNVTGRLLSTMMDEIRSELHRNSGYSREAQLVMAQKSVSPPVAVNRSI